MQNCFYPLDFADRIGSPQRYRTAFGPDIVLWKNEAGAIAAMDDRCPHMHASLADGKIVDGCLRCPYHHWRYQGDGLIAEIPSMSEGTAPGANFKAKTYPVRVQHGIVFVYFGDRPAEKAPPLPELPEFLQPEFRFVKGQSIWKAHIDTVAYNSLDFQHAAAMHMFGHPKSLLVPQYEVAQTEYSLSACIEQYFSEQLNLFPESDSAVATIVSDTISLPANSVVRFHSGKNSLVVVFALSPIDEYETRVTYMLGRNFHTGRLTANLFDLISHLFFLYVQYEDRRVVERIRVSDPPQLRVPADKLIIKYAQMLRHARASV